MSGEASSPFVAMTAIERSAAIGALLLIGLFTTVLALGTGRGNILILFAFFCYLGALALPLLIPIWRPSFFNPLVFHVLWIGVRSLLMGKLVLPATGLELHRAVPGGAGLEDVVALAFLLETVALLALYAGYVSMPNVRVTQWLIPRPSAVPFKSMLWLGLAAVGLVALATIGGGLDQVLMQRGIRSDFRIAAQVGGHWQVLAGLGVVIPLVWLAVDHTAIRKPIFWAVLVVALAIKFASTGSRGGTISPLIMVGIVYALQRRQIPYRAVGFGLVVALIVVGMLGEFRKATMRANILQEVELNVSLLESVAVTLEEGAFRAGENSGLLAVLANVPERNSYLYGESYLSIPFIVLPRALVGDKPDAAGRLVATRLFDNPYTAIPPGAVGEAYWNFSYGGVVLVFFAFGAIMKIVAAVFMANFRHPLVIIFFLYFITAFSPDSPSLYGFVHALVPAFLIYTSYVWKLPVNLRSSSFRNFTG